MKKPFLACYLLFTFFFAINSCKKADHLNSTYPHLAVSTVEYKSSVQPVGTDDDTTETPTVIDYQLPNPYTIPNMQQAYTNVTGQTATPAVTNLYVRFKPADLDQLQTLDAVAENADIELSDEPIDYHIVQEGNYYQDPSVPDEEITWQYAVVPPDFQPPSGIQYEVLAAIHIPEDISVEAEAERLVGLNADGDDYDYGAPVAHIAARRIKPYVPDCGPGYHWDFTLGQCVDNNCPSGYHWDNSQQHCVPDAPPPPPPPAFIPHGMLKVFDTQSPANPPAVRLIRVVARRWFKIQRTYTDDNGNFQVTKHFRNKVKLLVKFKNQFASIRGVRGVRVWQMFFPVKQKIGVYSGSSINSVDFTFPQTQHVQSVQNRYWAAATTLNAVQEHRDYASQFGFSAAPTGLNIYLTNWGLTRGLASTPLFNKRFIRDLPLSYINTILVGRVAFTAGGIASLLAVYARENVDMAVDYHMARFTSDHLKETVYHEMSHASHYNQVGTGWYSDFVNAELAEIEANLGGQFSPYGTGNTSHSPIIALGEAWGYHMGHFLADQRYGLNASCQFEQEGGVEFCSNGGVNHAHIDVLEQFDPNLADDPFHWIPKGLMLDMMDNTPFETVVNDQVSGYTIGQLFNGLQSDISSLQQYRDRLLQQNGNDPQVLLLFSQYHYN